MIVSYDGPIVREGRMSAVDAGTAIVGMANMVSAASRVLYGDGSHVTSEVETNFVKGSFEINFVVEQALGLMGHDASLNELMLLLFGPGHAGLLGLIKRLRGRKATKVEPTLVREGSDDISLNVQGDNNTITVNKNVYLLSLDQTARESAESVAKPLMRDGMDTVTIGKFKGLEIPSVTITSDEAPYFKAPPPTGTTVHKSVSEVYLRVVSPNFQTGSKWRVAQGDTSFFADIRDDEFWERIRKYEETFGDGDILVADMMTETQEVDGKLKIVRTIVKVKDHKAPRKYRQMGLEEQDT